MKTRVLSVVLNTPISIHAPRAGGKTAGRTWVRFPATPFLRRSQAAAKKGGSGCELPTCWTGSGRASPPSSKPHQLIRPCFFEGE